MKKNVIRYVVALGLFIPPAIAYASPGTAICLASSLVGEPLQNDSRIRTSGTFEPAELDQFSNYVVQGRSRIEKHLWESKSSPTVLFLDGKKVFGLLNYNQHGSALTLPTKTCLLIGPKGANVDVVAHELVHADIAGTLGYWNYLSFPAWINEGIAMQVDYRKQYNFADFDGVDSRYIESHTGRDFYQGEVRQNYATAKHLIAQWINVHGADQLLPNLHSFNFSRN
jgi:hypothetical protein